MIYVVPFSGGHSSARTAIYCVEKYGPENVIILNHDINLRYEDADIKRFKKEVSDFIGVPITYANINNIQSNENIPSQFDVCIKSKAITNKNGDALCTTRLKTEPFYAWLKSNFPRTDTLFQPFRDCTICYGFDLSEVSRVQRRASIMAAMGYKTLFPLLKPNDLTITNTRQIGIEPPTTYNVWIHANCVGCLKASLLHWYVCYCLAPEVYEEGEFMEDKIGGYTIHTVTRNKIETPISLKELRPIYEALRIEGVPATEHQGKHLFAAMIRKYQLEECKVGMPCACTE